MARKAVPNTPAAKSSAKAAQARKNEVNVTSVEMNPGGSFNLMDDMNKRFDLNTLADQSEENAEGLRQTPTAVDNDKATLSSVLTRPYPPLALEYFVKINPVVRACVDAMVINTVGHGGELKPRIQYEKRDGAWINKETDEVISAEEMSVIDAEYEALSMFFASASLDMSFDELCRRKQRNLTIFGYSYWEVETSLEEQPVGLTPVDSKTVYKTKLDKQAVPVIQWIRNPLTFEYVDQPRMKKFRRYLQRVGNTTVWFREFGCPLLMNSRTGEYIKKPDGAWVSMADYYAVQKAETTWEDLGIRLPENFSAANQLFEWKTYDTESEYGVPVTVSCTPHILSIRAADLVNYYLLSNNAIPPAVIIIEGYNDPDLEKRIKDELKHSFKGAAGFSRMLIVQAEAKVMTSSANANPLKPSIRIETLAPMLNKDGTFLEFTSRTEERIIGAFRLTNQFVGLTKDINYATAQVAWELVESQVFGPNRADHDYNINDRLLNALKIRYWKYETNMPRLNNIEQRAAILKNLSTFFTANEARPEVNKILGMQLEVVDEDWAKVPFQIAMGQARVPAQPFGPTVAGKAPPPPAAPVAGTPAGEKQQSKDTGEATGKRLEKMFKDAGIDAEVTDIKEDQALLAVVTQMLKLSQGLDVANAYLVINHDLPQTA